MKMLIVDDEKHVRSTIRKLVDWKSIGIEELIEAEDGNDAIRRIREHEPQIVITDLMMPVKSGLELLEWMEGHAPVSKKIVISGYNEFEYARHTIKYGCMDYLLKPIDRNQLQEVVLKAVRACEEVKKDQLKHPQIDIEVHELKQIFVDKMLSRLLTEPGPERIPALWGPLIKVFPDMNGAYAIRVAVLDLELFKLLAPGEFAADPERLVDSFVRICNDRLRNNREGVACRNWNVSFEIVLFLWKEIQTPGKIIEEIAVRLKRETKLGIPIGISAALPFAGGLQEVYKQAKAALNKRNLLQPASLIHEFRTTDSVSFSTLRFGNFEEEIRMAVHSGRADLIRSALQKWFDFVAAREEITVEQLKMWWSEYTIVTARWWEEFANRDNRDIAALPQEKIRAVVPIDSEGNFSFARLKEELTNDLIGFSQSIQSHLHKSNNVIHDIARYLQNHYTQEIALSELSARFHLNRDYISRKFKQEFRETIIDYVCRIRMEKAKMLLMNPHLKIVQVAEMVGYPDEKYFSRVFKKLENLSPREYRERNS